MGQIHWAFRNLVAAVALWGVACACAVHAQEPTLPALRGVIIAVQPPDDFEVDGYHVTITPETAFVAFQGPKKDPAVLRLEIEVGTYVQVFGQKNRHDHTIVARQLKVKSADRNFSGSGVIDRMIAAGPQPVFRADGYVIRTAAGTDVRFSSGLSTIDDVAPGTWVRYEGRPNTSGELVATRLAFARPKLHGSKRDPPRKIPGTRPAARAAGIRCLTFPRRRNMSAASA